MARKIVSVPSSKNDFIIVKFKGKVTENTTEKITFRAKVIASRE